MLTVCACPGHYAPIGFDESEPEYEYHGESMHPDAVRWQCMCGHPDYSCCEWACGARQQYVIQEEP